MIKHLSLVALLFTVMISYSQEEITIDGSKYIFREEPLKHSFVFGNADSTRPVKILSVVKVDGVVYYQAIGTFAKYSKLCFLEESQLPDSLNQKLQELLHQSTWVNVEVYFYNLKYKSISLNKGYCFKQGENIIRGNPYSFSSYQFNKNSPAVLVMPYKGDTLFTEFAFNDSIPERITIIFKTKKNALKLKDIKVTDLASYYSDLSLSRIKNGTCLVRQLDQKQLTEPFWTGLCIGGFANGTGQLFNYNSIPLYSGEIKDGLFHGYGRYYGNKVTEAIWEFGSLKELKKEYFREVIFMENDYYQSHRFKYYGKILEDSTMFYQTSNWIPDTTYFYSHISIDSAFTPKKVQSKESTLKGSWDHIFFIDVSHSRTRFLGGSSTYYKYLVQCKNRELIVVNRTKSSNKSRGTPYFKDIWFFYKGDFYFESTNAKDVLKKGCNCQ